MARGLYSGGGRSPREGHTNISDTPNERRQFANTYSAMTEGELQQLAADAGDLTAPAREALRQEIARRGLAIPLEEGGTKREQDRPRPVTLRVFGNLQEALLAKSILDSAGVRCFLADENMARLDSFMSTVVGGIKLWVDAEEAESARALLEAEIPGDFAVEKASEPAKPRCPMCESAGVSFEALNKSATYGGFVAKLLFPWKRRRWKCDSCGNEWQERDSAAT